jgi:amidase
MARTVRDAAILLTIIAGTDDADPATKLDNTENLPDYTQYLDTHGLRGARLGIARKFFGFNDSVDRIIDESIAEMKRLGADIVDPIEYPRHENLHESELDVLLYEFKSDLNVYLNGRKKTRVKTLSDIITFNEKNRRKEMPFFGQDLMIKADAKGPLTESAYIDALERNRQLCRTEGIDTVVRKYGLDAIVAPTTGPAWLTDWVTGDHESGSCSTPAAVAGYPHITVPAGFVHGLPVAISFFGPAWSEPTLLRVAYSFEQASRIRKAPNFLETVDFSGNFD